MSGRSAGLSPRLAGIGTLRHGRQVKIVRPYSLSRPVMISSVVPVAPADTSPFTQLLRDAEREADAFDEVFTPEGVVREPYETLLQVFEEGGSAEVSRLRGLIR